MDENTGPIMNQVVTNRVTVSLTLMGSQLGTFVHRLLVFCYIEFTLRSLKNLKLFSIRVKELLEPTVLQRKANRNLFFLKHLLERPMFISVDAKTTTTNKQTNKKRKR